MDFQAEVRARAFRKDATFLPQYFKNAQFDHKECAKASVFKVSVSGQKVYIYDRTHIPESNPVVRIQM
jgi:hypothetical protein